MLGCLDIHVAIQFQQARREAVFEAVRMSGCAFLLELRKLRNDDNPVAMVVDELFRADERSLVEANLDHAVAVEVAGLLINRAILASDISRRIFFSLAE